MQLTIYYIFNDLLSYIAPTVANRKTLAMGYACVRMFFSLETSACLLGTASTPVVVLEIIVKP